MGFEGIVGAQVKGLDMVERHIKSEYTNDIATIMGTISAVPRYSLVSGQHGSPVLSVLNERADVASYYAWTHEQHHEPIATRHPKQVVTEWYVFCEALPSQRPVGQSEIVLTNYALLFPFADDGMVGEIMWKRTVFTEPTTYADVDITITPPFAAGDVRSLRLYETFARAVAEGSVKDLEDTIADGCEAAVPSLDSTDGRLEVIRGRSALVTWLTRLSQQAEIVRSLSLNTVATSWYVFDERALSLKLHKEGLFGLAKGAEPTLRLAALYKLSGSGGQIDGISAIGKVEV
jgi:hypothetical protein